MGVATRDPRYRLAVEAITANCGAAAGRLLAADRARFTDRKVRELAGTSPDYQRHVLGRALAGDRNPFRPTAATLLVYDTVRFGEVTSRLHRAVGMVRQEAALMTRSVEQGAASDRLADRLITLDLVVDQASRLRELLTRLDAVGESDARPSRPNRSDAAPTDRLHAAGGLGLIAKNVRNVAALRPAHRPTPREKGVALWLTAAALDLAAAARDAARRAFGRADAACRVRPARTATRRVITHAGVDGDAAAAAWLAERFLLAGEPVEVLFLPPGRAFGAYRPGDCLVDVGNAHDPGHLFFDHRPPAFPDRHASCAARLVWDRLARLGGPVGHLKPLVDVVFAGDSARERAWLRDEYAASRREGFHKALADTRATEVTDAGVYRAVRRWLDALHRRTATRGR